MGKSKGMFDGMPSGASVEVQPKAIDDFATALLNDYSAAMNVINNRAADLAKAQFGVSGMSSSVDMANHYMGVGVQNGSYVEEMSKGAQAIAWGGRTIAANYVISDDAAQDQMSDVDAAFSDVPPAGSQTLAQAQAAAEAQNNPNENVTPANMPAPEDYSPDNYTPPTSDGQTCEVTPEQQAQGMIDLDTDENGGNGMADYRAPDTAPEAVQDQYDPHADENSPYYEVQASDGDTYWQPSSNAQGYVNPSTGQYTPPQPMGRN